MPIILPDGLPSTAVLRAEGVLAPAGRRPTLRIALVNLMPAKAATEIQFARLLALTPADIALTLLVPDGYRSESAPEIHMRRFYRPFSAIRGERFDGVIVTGAPVERMPFEAVRYWQSLTAIFDQVWTQATPTLLVCWAAQAALWHAHGVPKHLLPAKASGVFAQRIRVPDAPILAGLGEAFPCPVSRHTEVRAEDIARHADLALLAGAPETGPCLVEDRPRRSHLMFNHLEYDARSLEREYVRDLAAGLQPTLPANYFRNDDPSLPPLALWRPAAVRLFRNWVGLLGDQARNAASSRSMKPVSAGRRPAAAWWPSRDGIST